MPFLNTPEAMNMFHIQALPAGWMNAKPTYVFAMLYSIFTSDIENFSGDFYSDRAHIQALDVSAKAFAHMILDSLLRDLHYRRPPQKLWNRLRFMNLILVRWFFPSSHKSHRTCAPLEIVLATVVSAKSLIWLRTRHWTVQAQRVLRFLPPLARAALEWGGLPPVLQLSRMSFACKRISSMDALTFLAYISGGPRTPATQA